jgi:isocitrate/isopropylmalate dehydrogenase
MAKYKIAWLPGDGIGKDVLNAAKIILDELKLDAEYIPGEIGWEFWCKEGNALPERTIELLKKTHCCFFGAITSKPKEEAEAELDLSLKGKGYVYYSPIVKLRQLFNLRTNLRPCKAYPGNPLNYRDDIDLVVFRENTEDLYSGVEFHPLPQEVMDILLKNHKSMKKFEKTSLDDIAVSLRIVTRKACQNIVRDAFEYAKKHKRRSVTVVEKPNVIRETSGLMIREARKIAKEYPKIPLWETNIDAMCMWLVKNPQDYDVLVTSNMFGDIVSDLCAQLVGGLGFACSGNIGDDYAVFEPTHGSAPKYAGMDKVNPIATFLSVKLMLDWLGETEKANRLENAIATVIKEGKARTYDMGGSFTTTQVAEEVTRKLGSFVFNVETSGDSTTHSADGSSA